MTPAGGGPVRTVAWWHCFAGIAGNMALGSLLDAGAPLDRVERGLEALPVRGWSLDVTPVLRGGVAATHVEVTLDDSPVPRTHAHIVGLLTEARLPDRVRDRALATFAVLAEVEGRLHRRPPAEVHFHEVGSTDAIVDVVGSCLALELLGVDQIWASPVAQGTGMIRSAHGLLPNPAPAVVALLARAGAPSYGTHHTVELTTPTGAALLAALATGFGPMPAMTVRAVGHGAGSRELDGTPNAVQVVVGDAAPADDGPGRPAVLLEANVDDVTGEILGHVVAAALAAGAHDAWLTPVTGKKGRPAYVVAVLADPASAAGLRDLMATETGTLGVRSRTVDRWMAPRSVARVTVEGHPVAVKWGPSRVKAEHDDAVRVAGLTGLPVREVARRAEEAAHAARAVGDGRLRL